MAKRFTEYFGKCHCCGEDCYGPEGLARPCWGWEPLRPGEGGANHVIQRTVIEGHVAHAECVKKDAAKARAGISTDQIALL